MKKRMTLLGVTALCVACTAIGAASASVARRIEAELRPDFRIEIDGQEKIFKNAKGEVVYPILYEGTTYLPVRAIGELMGKKVYWYENEKRIELQSEKTTVTDADVIVNDSTDFIGESKAKEIALSRAGLSENDVTYLNIKLDRDDRVWQYEIEFRHNRIEYDIDVNATNGNIISFDRDID